MKNSEIREMTPQELEEQLEAKRSELKRMKMNHAISPLDNPMQIRGIRKDVARILTELTKRSKSETKEQE